MSGRFVFVSLVITLELTVLGLAHAGVGPDDLSTAWSPEGCLMIEPSGTGPTLSSRGLTVTVTVRDSNGSPIQHYPRQDIWLGDDAGGTEISLCSLGSAADANTNALGVTTISGAIAGGGWTQNGLQVRLAGVPLFTSPPLPISLVSPDINGDLRVDLIDVGDFAVDFSNASYDFRSDLTCDGREDLADVGEIAFALLEGPCP